MTRLRKLVATTALAAVALPGLALADDDRYRRADDRALEWQLMQALTGWNSLPAPHLWRGDQRDHRGWDDDDDDHDDRRGRGDDDDDDDD